MLKLSNDFADIAVEMRSLRTDLEREGLRLGINRTLQRGRTEAARAVADEFNVKVGDARAQMRVSTISRKGGQFVLSGELEAFGVRRGRSSRNVMLFEARPAPGKETKTVRFPTAQGWRTRKVQVGGGVSVKIKKRGGRKVIEGAFIANKGRTVFIRTGGLNEGEGPRLPIKGVETVDVPQMFNTRSVNARILKRTAEILAVEVERGIVAAMQRFGKGGTR